MNNTRLLTLVVIGLLITGYWLLNAGQAQPAGAAGRATVGAVNVARVLKDAKEMQALREEFDKEKEGMKSDMKGRQGKVHDLELQLSRYNAGTKDYDNVERQLTYETINLNVWMEVSQKNLAKKFVAKSADFYTRMCEVIKDLAKQQGLDLVVYYEESLAKEATSPEALWELVSQRQVLFQSNQADITANVLNAMDAAFAKGAAAAPAPDPAPAPGPGPAPLPK